MIPYLVSPLQVNCLEEQCGLSPFAGKNPDQWYRFILANFLHSGVIHVVFVLVFQHGVISDVEKMAGWWRVGECVVLGECGWC